MGCEDRLVASSVLRLCFRGAVTDALRGSLATSKAAARWAAVENECGRRRRSHVLETHRYPRTVPCKRCCVHGSMRQLSPGSGEGQRSGQSGRRLVDGDRAGVQSTLARCRGQWPMTAERVRETQRREVIGKWSWPGSAHAWLELGVGLTRSAPLDRQELVHVEHGACARACK